MTLRVSEANPLTIPPRRQHAEREKRLKAEQAKLSPRKSPAKAQVAAATKAANAVSEDNQIHVSADDLLQVKEMLEEKNRGML